MAIRLILAAFAVYRLAGMVATYLQQNGFEVLHAETAKDGLAQLQSSRPDAPFSLVLLDLMLPDADGLDAADYPTPNFGAATSPDAIAEGDLKLSAGLGLFSG